MSGDPARERARINPSDEIYKAARAHVFGWLSSLHASVMNAIPVDDSGQLVDGIAWLLQDHVDAAALTSPAGGEREAAIEECAQVAEHAWPTWRKNAEVTVGEAREEIADSIRALATPPVSAPAKEGDAQSNTQRATALSAATESDPAPSSSAGGGAREIDTSRPRGSYTDEELARLPHTFAHKKVGCLSPGPRCPGRCVATCEDAENLRLTTIKLHDQLAAQPPRETGEAGLRAALADIAGLTWSAGNIHGGWEAAHQAIKIARAALTRAAGTGNEWERGFTKLLESRFLMATTALHMLGDISRDDADLCVAHSEDADYWMGNWSSGLGFINVKFPKATTRPLTDEETERFRRLRWVLNGVDYGPVLPPATPAERRTP